ncbi:hypothetical protein ABT158_09835 [Nonomuraea sp. NPDC001636]|uniref:hypothetical protein n=1 Tax=Nonomuraea sp. NPDC001636 TaxID=3154391 RepID=UPI00331AF574
MIVTVMAVLLANGCQSQALTFGGPGVKVSATVCLADLPVLHVNPIGAYARDDPARRRPGFSVAVMKEVPVEPEEAARIDGVGELRVIATITVPRCLRLHRDLGPVPAAADRLDGLQHPDPAHRPALAPLSSAVDRQGLMSMYLDGVPYPDTLKPPR